MLKIRSTPSFATEFRTSPRRCPGRRLHCQSVVLVCTVDRNGLRPDTWRRPMANAAAQPVARTPGAKRAGPGEDFFELTKVDPIKGGPPYSTPFPPRADVHPIIVALIPTPAPTTPNP